MEVIASVFKDDTTAIISLKTTDSLVDIRQAIQQQLSVDLTNYVIMYRTNNGNSKQILTEDVSLQLLFNSKKLELFLEELQPNETSQRDGNGIEIISINVTQSLPVVQHTTTLIDGSIDNKFKKWLGLKQHFDAKAISTKFFISEIPSNNGVAYLEQHLIKNDMPIPVQEFIRNKLFALINCQANVSDYKTEVDRNLLKKNESGETIVKMKSKILNNQLIVVVAYALLNNEQKNFATSLVKKMVPDRKFNKDVEDLLDEWVDEKIMSV